MSQETHLRRPSLFVVLIGALLLFTSSACQKKRPPASEEVLPMDRVAPTPVSTTEAVLHKTFAVAKAAIFPFEVPAHAVTPRLHGNFKSYVKQVSIQSSDESADVDFLILTRDQYDDFVHGRAGAALFSLDTSHDQDVNVTLPGYQDQPQKYYLVFRNSPGGEAKKLVQADFTVDF